MRGSNLQCWHMHYYLFTSEFVMFSVASVPFHSISFIYTQIKLKASIILQLWGRPLIYFNFLLISNKNVPFGTFFQC